MDAPTRALALRQRLAAWSDWAQHDAVELAESYRDLLPRQITNAQLNGLQNTVLSAPSFGEIKKYVENQSNKASRAGRDDVADYWKALLRALTDLRSESEQLLNSVPGGPPLTTVEGRQLADEWHRRLAREYVQHLVAHSLWVKPGDR